MRNTLFIWLSILFILSGCVTNHPKDVAILSIKVVDEREQAELPPTPAADSFKSKHPYRDFLFALSEAKGDEPIKPEDMAVYFREQGANQTFKNSKPQKPLLRVEFTSNGNLYQFAKENSYPVAIWPYFCKRPEELIPRNGRVYWNGLDVGAPLNYEMWKNGDEPFVYYTFLDVAFSAKQPSSHESFDLRTDPEDICFRVGGGFAGRGFKSNAVVIPKAEIIKALEQMPPALR